MSKIIIMSLIIVCFSCIAYCQKPSVDQLNPDFERYMDTATRWKTREGQMLKYWTCFFFADTHSNSEEFGRLMEFYSKHSKWFDEVYCAGDMVNDNIKYDDFTYWSKVPGHEKVLMCIGNHDVQPDKGVHPDKGQISQKDTYNMFFAPFIKNWNCVYEEGHTYYYKDYDKKGLRLITLDCMLHGKECEEMHKWFEKTVKDTLDKKYSLIVVNHVCIDDPVIFQSNFTHKTAKYQSVWFNMMPFQKTIDGFMNAGGDFVCWLGGHHHCDTICYSKAYPKQLNILIDAADQTQSSWFTDCMRTEGTRNEDVANAIIVDLTRHQIKILRVGANINEYLEPRNSIVIDYKTKEILAQN